ncbi:hypothetical protein BU17DRAFT_97086 [Hysterangium stoloniferum]|nr:hypothetical protein BU17DRAFT_97086 [Hysterangium stoloniferum]
MAQSAHHTQVVICGAGPVSLLVGIVLASHGVQVRILEALSCPSESPRAIVYQPANRVLLQPSVVASLYCQGPSFQLETFANAEISFDSEVIYVSDGSEQGPVCITCKSSQGNTSRITCDWLIGADGSKSIARKIMNIEFAGFTWPKEEFVTTDVLYPFSDFDFTSGKFFVDPVHWGIIAAIDPEKHLWRVAYGWSKTHGRSPGRRSFRPSIVSSTTGTRPESLLNKWPTLRHQAFSEYTNQQSIESKRIVQRGGYSEDPANIWAHDAIAEAHGMTKWLQKATPEAKERDRAMFRLMADESIRLRALLSTWDAALAVDWMNRRKR